jgi:hypothetical protein
LVVAVRILERRRDHSNGVHPFRDRSLVHLLLQLAVRCRLAHTRVRQQVVEAGHLQQLEGEGADVPGIFRFIEAFQELHGIVECTGNVGGEAPLQHSAICIAAPDEEARESELPQRPGLAHGTRHGGLVEVHQHRPGSGVPGEVDELLAGVLQREKHRDGGGTSGLGQCVEQ